MGHASPPIGVTTAMTGLSSLGPFGVGDTVTVTSAVTPDTLASTLATIQAATVTSCERAVGASTTLRPPLPSPQLVRAP
jgi:hypothetical protein